MWQLLYQLASPKSFYLRTKKWTVYLSVSAVFFILFGLVWGLAFAPADYQQGEAYRIIFIHVPCAFLSMTLFAWTGILAFILLVWRIKMAGLIMLQAAKTGACMTVLALLTGSIWGRPMWGSFWVWDARLTSELILLFLYLGILVSSRAFKIKQSGEKMAAVLALIGIVDLPIIHYSVSWWNTLHQGSTLSVFSPPKIALPMLLPLLISITGFFLYAVFDIIQSARIELLWREKQQSWVRDMMMGENHE